MKVIINIQGPAGVGKSAIGQSIKELLQRVGISATFTEDIRSVKELHKTMLSLADRVEVDIQTKQSERI